MASLGTTLTGWMRMVLGHEQTFAASVFSSPNARGYSLSELRAASVEDVANRIVRLDGGGIWLLRLTNQNARGPQDDEVRVFSYVDDRDALESVQCGPR